jgi:hypothetical protein
MGGPPDVARHAFGEDVAVRRYRLGQRAGRCGQTGGRELRNEHRDDGDKDEQRERGETPTP